MSKVTLPDPSLKHSSLKLYPELEKLENAYFRAVPEMCVERSDLITKYHLDNDLFSQEKISVLDKAKTYRYVLRNRSISIQKSYRPLRRLDLLRRKTCQ